MSASSKTPDAQRESSVSWPVGFPEVVAVPRAAIRARRPRIDLRSPEEIRDGGAKSVIGGQLNEGQ